MMRLHSLRATRASFYSFADPLFVNTAADANDHANDLQHMRMIVKNDSQLRVFTERKKRVARARGSRLFISHDDCIDAP